MSDDRPAVDPVEALAALQRRVDDLESTTAARMLRRPTGDVELTLRTTPKPDTLLLQGQTLSRATYAALWRWVQDNGLSPAVFGVGDGATSFTLPDLRGKAAVGATVVDPVGKSFGSATVTLTTAMMPQHNHDGLTDWSDRTHIHGGSTDNDGGHGGHFPGSQFNAMAGPDLGLAAWNSGGGGRNHSHHFTSATESQGHKHDFVTSYTGAATPEPFFVVQPSYAVNWLIWT